MSLKMLNKNRRYQYWAIALMIVTTSTLQLNVAQAHHVLGRPSYSLSEDSTTPPSMQVETQIGKYFINFAAFPAFPKPNEPGRLNLYATRIDNGEPFNGTVTFLVRDDSWFSSDEEVLGQQQIDDGVYRQGFVFTQEGSYLITARFQALGEPYVIDFPIRIGDPAPIGPLGFIIAMIVALLVGVNLIQRKRLLLRKTRVKSTSEIA